MYDKWKEKLASEEVIECPLPIIFPVFGSCTSQPSREKEMYNGVSYYNFAKTKVI